MPDRTLDSSLDSIISDLFDKVYSVPYPGQSSYHQIARFSHGIQHVTRAALYAPAFVNLYKQAKNPEAEQLTEREIKLIQIAILCHDAAREDDGVDRWDRQSADFCYNYLRSIGASDEEARRFSEAVANKDDDYTPSKNIVASIIHDSDCLDIMRVRDEFDVRYLDLLEWFSHSQNEELLNLTKHPLYINLGELLSEAQSLIATHGDFIVHPEPELKRHFEQPNCLSETIEKILSKGFFPVMQEANDIPTPETESYYRYKEFSEKREAFVARGVLSPNERVTHRTHKSGQPKSDTTGIEIEFRKMHRTMEHDGKEGNPLRSSSLLFYVGLFSHVGLLFHNHMNEHIVSVNKKDIESGFFKKTRFRQEFTAQDPDVIQHQLSQLCEEMRMLRLPQCAPQWVTRAVNCPELLTTLVARDLMAIYYSEDYWLTTIDLARSIRTDSNPNGTRHRAHALLKAVFMQGFYKTTYREDLPILEFSNIRRIMRYHAPTHEELLTAWRDVLKDLLENRQVNKVETLTNLQNHPTILGLSDYYDDALKEKIQTVILVESLKMAEDLQELQAILSQHSLASISELHREEIKDAFSTGFHKILQHGDWDNHPNKLPKLYELLEFIKENDTYSWVGQDPRIDNDLHILKEHILTEADPTIEKMPFYCKVFSYLKPTGDEVKRLVNAFFIISSEDRGELSLITIAVKDFLELRNIYIQHCNDTLEIKTFDDQLFSLMQQHATDLSNTDFDIPIELYIPLKNNTSFLEALFSAHMEHVSFNHSDDGISLYLMLQPYIQAMDLKFEEQGSAVQLTIEKLLNPSSSTNSNQWKHIALTEFLNCFWQQKVPMANVPPLLIRELKASLQRKKCLSGSHNTKIGAWEFCKQLVDWKQTEQHDDYAEWQQLVSEAAKEALIKDSKNSRNGTWTILLSNCTQDARRTLLSFAIQDTSIQKAFPPLLPFMLEEDFLQQSDSNEKNELLTQLSDQFFCLTMEVKAQIESYSKDNSHYYDQLTERFLAATGKLVEAGADQAPLIELLNRLQTDDSLSDLHALFRTHCPSELLEAATNTRLKSPESPMAAVIERFGVTSNSHSPQIVVNDDTIRTVGYNEQSLCKNENLRRYKTTHN